MIFRKYIFVHGYWEKNLGDDLFLYILRHNFPDEIFYICARREFYNHYTSLGFRVIITNSIIYRILNKISRFFSVDLCFVFSKLCGFSLVLGGSLFMQVGDWRRHLLNYKFMTKLGAKVAVIGSNFGPFHSEKFRSEYESFFLKNKFVSFRDAASASLFSKSTNIFSGPDFVCNFPTSKLRNVERSGNRILISVINFSSRDKYASIVDAYEESILDMITCFRGKGFVVELISFCEFEGDLSTIESVCSKAVDLKVPDVCYLSYTGDFEILNKINEFDYLVAGRFHAMVLAFLLNIRVMPIAYSDKFKTGADELGFEGLMYTPFDFIKIDFDNIVMDNLFSLNDSIKLSLPLAEIPIIKLRSIIDSN